MLNTFYKSVVENVVCFAAICWGSSIRASDSKKTEQTDKEAGSVLWSALKQIVQKRTLHI